MGHVLEAPGPYQKSEDIVAETRVEKLQPAFIIIEMRGYLLKEQLQMKCNLQKHHFVYAYEVIIKFYPNFMTCLYFSLALIR